MRKIIRPLVAAAVAGVLSIGLIAAPAQAAAAGSTCKLSANWTVKFSANYDIVNGQSDVHYVVLNSPGAIKKWRITMSNASGSVSRVATLTNPDKLTKIYINQHLLDAKFYMEVWGGNSSCHTYVYAY